MAIRTDRLAFLLVMAASTHAAAATTVGELERFFEASRRLEAGEAVEPRVHYQAGFYAGYLAAIRERLVAAGHTCLDGCRCKSDEAIEGAFLLAPAREAEALGWADGVLLGGPACR
jgi:hypothetical protein